MKHLRLARYCLTFLVLLLLLAGCGSDDKDEPDTSSANTETTSTQTETQDSQAAETVAPTQAPTNNTPPPEPTPTVEAKPTATAVAETPDAQEPLGDLQIGALEEMFDSYRSRGKFGTVSTLSDGEKREQSMIFEIDWLSAEHEFGADMAMLVSGSPESNESVPQAVEMFAIADTMYVNVEDQWFTSPRETMGLEQVPFFANVPEDFQSSIGDAKREGNETINGIETIHYSYDGDALFGDILNDAQIGLLGLNRSTRADIWLAEDEGYVVKYSIEAQVSDIPEGEDSDTTMDQTLQWSFEIYEVDTLDSIDPPEGAPQPGEVSVPGFAPGTFPLPPDSEVMANIGGMVSISSPQDQDVLNAFMDEKLEALGWSKEGGFPITWSKGDVTLIFMVTPDDSGGSMLMIMGE